MRLLPRRALAWLALIGLLLYGVEPLLRVWLPNRVVPLACAMDAVHSCSCSITPHTSGGCCCKNDAADANQCSVSPLPCDGGSDLGGVEWSARSPLLLPVRALQPVYRFVVLYRVPESLPSLRQTSVDPVTPPPQPAFSA